VIAFVLREEKRRVVMLTRLAAFVHNSGRAAPEKTAAPTSEDDTLDENLRETAQRWVDNDNSGTGSPLCSVEQRFCAPKRLT
jgi:hypothetical protein